MNPFRSKIRCLYCSKFHKRKKTGSKIGYICSTYDNQGADRCRRNKIDHNLLVELLSLRYGKILTDDEIIDKVKLVTVSEEKIVIEVLDGDDILLTSSHGSF